VEITLETDGSSINSTEPNAQAMGLSIDEMKEVLDHVDPEPLDYNDWLRVGMGIYHETGGSDEGYDLWEKWSEGSEKHNNTKMTAKWESLKNPPERAVTFRTVRVYSYPIRRPLNDAGNTAAVPRFLLILARARIPICTSHD
jgi:Primase C terminal 2 (PriCT-2)